MGALLFYFAYVTLVCCIGLVAAAWAVRSLWRRCVSRASTDSTPLADEESVDGEGSQHCHVAVWRAVCHPDGETAVGVAQPK